MFEGQHEPRTYHAATFNADSSTVQLFTGKVADTIAQNVTILKLKEYETIDWKREEHVTIEVNDMTPEAFLVILFSCYTGKL